MATRSGRNMRDRNRSGAAPSPGGYTFAKAAGVTSD
jgi:hypothetical protein